jgi:ATP-dependent Clp protease ATP-binding subunit ClpB
MDDGRTSSASSSSRSTSSPPASACEIELTERARELLANLGYDPTYGARPLKRVVQKQLVDKLALRILEGEFSEGDTVEVDAHDGELTFAKARGRARKPEAERTAA